MWRDEQQFANKFSPANQIKTSGKELQCFTSDTPCVAAVKNKWGIEFTKKWLATHLIELNEYCGVKEKMSVPQIDQLSHILVTKYGYLKPQEFMVFFIKFKAGEYGHLYGVIDPMVISDAFNKFLEYRFYQMQKAESERERKEKEEQSKLAENLAISFEEYMRRKKNER